jgi:two-component system cell cycle response regulator
MLGGTRADMVILDIMMPGMNGFEVCKRLKESPTLQGIIVVGVSGNHEPEVRERIMNAGADLFFTKPLDLATFRDACYRLLKI